ncbi:MAG: hypothetical protein E7246_00965 [Lachnoclostridium sp.]|nr:hypothetical protein [Lachnoclostridium sp.]
MKLLKRMALLSLCVLALSGCTQSSINTNAPLPIPQDGVNINDKQMDDREIEKIQLVEDGETEPATMFDWEQVADEAEDIFGDKELYPLGVKMSYACDEDAKTVELAWVMKNGTAEADALAYATELVQMFNDILAVQTTEFEFANVSSFGTVWEQFALSVQVATEDGTVIVDKNYEAGDIIDLPLPEVTGNGPQISSEDEESPKKPGDK